MHADYTLANGSKKINGLLAVQYRAFAFINLFIASREGITLANINVTNPRRPKPKQ